MAVKSPAPQVLVVDDEEALVDLICNMLKITGITAEPCPLGIQAFQYIRRAHPQLVVLDMMMPEVDGLTLFRQLRNDSVTATIPILLISAGHINPTKNVVGFREHYDAFLPKPFGIHTLINTVRTLLRGSVPKY